jgi:uncharacterized membrane protein YkvA (DUF1232 family)
MKRPLKLIGLFKQAIDNLKIMRYLWRDYRNGQYRTLPVKAIAAMGLLLVYILNPFDLVADFVPLWGQLDDFGVLMICLYLLDRETTQYQLWRTNRYSSPDEESKIVR